MENVRIATLQLVNHGGLNINAVVGNIREL